MSLSVLIIDNNIELCDFLTEFIDEQTDFAVIGQAYDGQDGLKKILEEGPDIVVLDVTMPKMDGLEVLEHLKNAQMQPLPRILVLTAFGREEVLQEMRQLGVQQVLLKPFTLETLLLRLRELYGSPMVSQSPTMKQANRETLDAEITNALLELGIPSHFKGFSYLKESVLLSVTKGFFGGSLSSNLYPPVSARFGATPSGVEAAIRNAVSYAWDNGNQASLRALCGPYQKKRVPTNAVVIACLAEWFRSQRG